MPERQQPQTAPGPAGPLTRRSMLGGIFRSALLDQLRP
jgi:hypothetical protein